MRYLLYSYPKVEINVYPQGDLVMHVSDNKATAIQVKLGPKEMELMLQAIAAAQARLYPNPPGQEVLDFKLPSLGDHNTKQEG